MQNSELNNYLATNLYRSNYENKHRILMLGWEFPPQKNGGLGVACHGILKAYNKLNVSIDFALPNLMPVADVKHNFIFADQINKVGKFSTLDIFKDVGHEQFDYYTGYSKLHSFKIPGENFFLNHHINLDHISKTLEQRVHNYSNDLAKFILLYKKEYQLVHAHDWLTAPTAILLKEMFDIPFVFHIHATEIDRAGEYGNQDIFDIEKEAMIQAKEIWCVSNFTKKVIEKYYHIDPEKIKVVHNGIDTDDFSPSVVQDERKLAMLEEFFSLKDEGYHFALFVGRLTYQKGIEFLLQAAKIVNQYNKKVFFLIIGRGDQEIWLLEESARLGLGDRVIFCGWQDELTIKALYNLGDIFIMPSRSEPFGLVALEAALQSTPIIASKNSGAIEVLPHSLNVEYWDTDKIAHYILSIVEYPALKKTISEFALNHVLQLDWVRSAKIMVENYKNLLTG